MTTKISVLQERLGLIQLSLAVVAMLALWAEANGFIALSLLENVSRDGLFILFLGFLFLPVFNPRKYKYTRLISSSVMIVAGVLMLTDMLPSNFVELPVILVLILVIGLALFGIERFQYVFLDK